MDAISFFKSLAAVLVKVTARIRFGFCPCSNKRATRRLILFLDKKLYWIPEENLCQTRRSPQSIMEKYGQGLQRSMAQILPGRLKDFYQGIV